MKKIIAVIICISALLFASCGSGNESGVSNTTAGASKEPSEGSTLTSTESKAATTTEAAQTISAEDILKTIKEAVNPKEDMITLLPGDDDYADSFEYLFDLDVKMTSDSAVCYCASGRLADEIDVFVLNDENDSGKMENALKKRANSRSSRYRGYYDAESDKAKNALVISKGKYVAFVISDDNNAAERAFENLF